MTEIGINEALNMTDNVVYIDVRSPEEHEEDALPGSINIPLLDDNQRKLVGITYKKVGKEEARIMGLELVSKDLPNKIKKIKIVSETKIPIVYCWRGGMRSKAMSQVLSLSGIDNYRLTGGYKAYRKYVFEKLYENNIKQDFYVLYGLTGSGKSDIIKELLNKNIPAINLEEIACHRGSVFGAVGLEEQPTQKKFESRLYSSLDKFRDSNFIIVEGESSKIGKLNLPEKFFNKMKAGKHILVYTTLENRVKRIIKEYFGQYDETKNSTIIDQLANSIRHLNKRLGTSTTNFLLDKLHKHEFEELVSYLLLNYYDNLYQHPATSSNDYDFNLQSDNIEIAIQDLLKYINQVHSIGG